MKTLLASLIICKDCCVLFICLNLNLSFSSSVVFSFKVVVFRYRAVFVFTSTAVISALFYKDLESHGKFWQPNYRTHYHISATAVSKSRVWSYLVAM